MLLAERSLLAILEYLPVAVVVADQSGRVIFENDQATETLGHSMMHVDGLAAYGTLFGRTSEGVPLAAEDYPLPRALRGETVAATEYRYVKPDGVETWLRAVAAPILEDGLLRGATVMFRNIDAERDSAEALRAAERRLEETLREQAEALRQADRRKDQFLAALSHELRNPLGAITSALQVMRLPQKPDGATPPAPRAMEIVERQVTHITRLVDDLAEISRISEGKVSLQLARVGLADIVQAGAETIRSRVDERRQRLTIEAAQAPMFVLADSQRLTQVLVNLLSNASKYTDEGGAIHVTARPNNGFAELMVRDTGIGIPPAMQGHVFDLFTQVDEHRARSEGGLGLGLALVQRLVHLHGGTVSVSSEGHGKGSEFVVRLPLLASGR